MITVINVFIPVIHITTQFQCDNFDSHGQIFLYETAFSRPDFRILYDEIF